MTTDEIDLALAIFEVSAEPGRQYSCAEIAAFCGCDDQTIKNIENKALAKLRKAVCKAGIQRAG